LTKYNELLPQCVIDDLTIPPGFIEAIRKKDGIDMDIFGEPAYNYYDGENPFTDAYKAFYGIEKEEPEKENLGEQFVKDMIKYYGEDNLTYTLKEYMVIYQDMCTLSANGYKPDVELNNWMAEDAKETKAAREKTERSQPLWNALKY